MGKLMARVPVLRRSVALVASAIVIAIGCGPLPVGEGEACELDTQCAEGSCVELDGRHACSSACEPGAACPAAHDGTAQVCREDGFCHAPCAFRGAREGSVCRDGVVAACTELDAASACSDCGCEPYGGGVSVMGTGCVQPAADGEACTEDRLCASGLCDAGTCVSPAADGAPCNADRFCASALCEPTTDRCISPLGGGAACTDDRYCGSGICGVLSRVCMVPGAIGDECGIDRECESANCSNDGDTSRAGRCNQRLGEVCDRDHCNYCLGADRTFGEPGVCARERCAPGLAPCLGSWASRRFDCQPSADGPYYCYEQCPRDEDEAWDYNCLGDFDRCHWESGVCY